MEYKNFPLEIKAIDLEEGEFDGYAAVFDNIDLVGDSIKSGAFKKTLRERGKKIKLLWQHELNKPLGRPVKIREDEHGLHIKVKISDTRLGQDVLTLMRDGVIDELSIGYEVVKDNKIKVRGKDVRELDEIKLWEISLVTIAANPEAQVENVKELDELELKEAIPCAKKPLPGEEDDEEQPAKERPSTREERDFEPAADQKVVTAVNEPPQEETLRLKVGLKLKYLQPFVED